MVFEGKRWVGRLRYEPPAWWGPASQSVFVAGAELRARAAATDARKAALVVSAAALPLLYSHFFVAHPPTLDSVSVTVSAPGARRLEEGAKPEPLRVNFSGPAAPLKDIGKRVPKGIALEPSPGGSWSWVSDSELVFTPDQDWEVGRDYSVRLGSELAAPRVRLIDSVLRFRSAPFTASLKSAEFYQDPRDPALKQVVATFVFSHPVDAASFEKRLRLERERAPVPAAISYDAWRGEAYVRTGPVAIPSKDSSVAVVLEEGVRSARGGPAFKEPLKAAVAIPGLSTYFHAEGVEAALARDEHDDPHQVLVLTLNTGARPGEVNRNLSAFVLPVDKPSMQGQLAVKNYLWENTAEIGPEVLAAAEPLALEPGPAEGAAAAAHSFRFKAPPGRALYIRLAKGARSFGGYVLAETFDRVVMTPDYPQELSFVGDGALLSLSGERRLSVVARGLRGLRFEVSRILPREINHLLSQTSGEFRNPAFRGWSFGPDDISERFEERRALAAVEPGRAVYAALELDRYREAGGGEKRGLFLVTVQGWDPSTRTDAGPSARRLILITDLGLLVKEARGGARTVFVQSLSSGTPAARAHVTVLGKNGLAVAEADADGEGRVSLPSLQGLERERTPVAITARRGADLSFIPYDWEERRLQLSRFDVGGVTEAGDPEGLKAYLFSDRGLYRPGDEVRLGYVVKAADWGGGLTGLPVEAVLSDPRGLVVLRERLRLSADGFGELRYTPGENAPTGGYSAALYIVKDARPRGLLGTLTVRVEEFLPDRMSVSARFDPERRRGWVKPEGVRLLAGVRTLFGTPGQGRRVSAELVFSPGMPALSGYPGFVFHNPNNDKKTFRERLEDATTNDAGEAAFSPDLARFSSAVYSLTAAVEAYEAGGGRAVGAQAGVLVSDLERLLGYKADGELGYVARGSTRAVDIVAVGPDLGPVVAGSLTEFLLELRTLSVLRRQRDGTYRYESAEVELPVSSRSVSVPLGGLHRRLPSRTPGSYALTLEDSSGAELLRVLYTVAGHGNLSRSLEKNAELKVALDKHDYAPGEPISVSIVAPYAGAGLITIERDKVYAAKWFRAGKTATVETLAAPAGLEGNGYLSVAFVRALDSPEVFMSPLSYGVAPFSVSRDRRSRRITLEAPAAALPGQPLAVRFRTDAPARIVVYAVDEGILQAAGYATPDPLAKFLEKRALEVRTSQILDQLLPEFSLVRRAAAGGDGWEALKRNLNPFKRRREKPVACWSGIIEAGTDWRSVSCPLPEQFNGTVRVMAVAVSDDAVGAAESRTVVRGPFVLTPTAPAAVAPGDDFELGLALRNDAEGSGPQAAVVMSLALSSGLAAVGEAERTLIVPEGSEARVVFRLRARDLLGPASATVTASWGKERSRATAELSVRPAVPYRIVVTGAMLSRGRAETPLDRRLYPHFSVLEASVSPLPLVLARGLASYLEKFPHGCTEQLVSQTFPAVVLRRRPEFGYAPETTAAMLGRTLMVLRARQNAEGAFGFYAANSHVVPFQTVYAAHFLTETREAGFHVPADLLDRALGFIETLAGREPESLPEARVSAYALYVLARNGRVVTRQAGALRSWLSRQARGTWETDLTVGYLASTYKLLHMDGAAADLSGRLRLGQPQVEDYAWFYDGLLRDSQLLALFARHFPQRLEFVDAEELEALVRPLNEGRFNTLSAASAIVALEAYGARVSVWGEADAAVSERNRDGTRRTLALPPGLFQKVVYSSAAAALSFENLGTAPLFYQAVSAGFDHGSSTPAAAGLEVQRELRDAEGRTVSRAEVGQELSVHLRLRSRGGARPNIAVVDLLPGGTEVILDPAASQEGAARLAAEGSTWTPDYADVREDRVVLYGLAGPEAREFVYKVRAVAAGNFTVPPPFAESMYDRGVQAFGEPGMLSVAARP